MDDENGSLLKPTKPFEDFTFLKGSFSFFKKRGLDEEKSPFLFLFLILRDFFLSEKESLYCARLLCEIKNKKKTYN